MSTIETILATAKKTLLSESKSIENLVNYLDEDFAKSVDKPERVVNLFPESNQINKQAEGWGGSIFDLNPFKK